IILHLCSFKENTFIKEFCLKILSNQNESYWLLSNNDNVKSALIRNLTGQYSVRIEWLLSSQQLAPQLIAHQCFQLISGWC
ncbi:hypothetical protein, partial [Citrobacter freundii]|uniref:hypothetical protein n=1 Tax=Citrobacter freundii TaxID=546 RepID=UPI001F4A94FF